MSGRLRLRARDRRALLVGLAVLAPAAAYRAGVGPWLEYRAGLADALTAERDLLARERAAVREVSRIPEDGDAIVSEMARADGWLLAGPSAMAASGDLSRHVTERARQSAILIQELQARAAPGSATALEPVSLTIRALGDLEGISRFLHALENGERLVSVEQITLRTAGVNDGDLERGQLLSFGAVVTGYRRRATRAVFAEANR